MLQKAARATEALTKPAAAVPKHYIRSKMDEFGPISARPLGGKAHFQGNGSRRTKLFINHRVSGGIGTNDSRPRRRSPNRSETSGGSQPKILLIATTIF